MHATIALLPLVALATTVIAAPTSLHHVARAVPDVKAVIRNPAPVDHRSGFEISVDVDLPKVNDILHRAAPAVDKIRINPVDVVGRAVPNVEKKIKDPTDVVG